MTEIQLGSGASSSTTHHLTQLSQTQSRRGLERPSNLAIEEAAQTVHSTTKPSSARPSRLVNLRLHASDLVNYTEDTAPATPAAPVVPQVIELGTIDRTQREDCPIDLRQVVPNEAPIEETPVYTSIPVSSSALTLSQQSSVSTPVASNINTDALAIDIAADYATANLGTVNVANDTIDTIARATSEAIAAIRTASDPEEVAEQVASLKTFADTIKASSGAPEMLELSNTIEKFVDVAMKSTKVQEEVQKKLEAKRAAEKQVAVKKSIPTIKPAVRKPVARTATSARPASSATTRTAAKRPTMRRPVAKSTRRTSPSLVKDEDQALRKALRNVAAMDGETEKKPVARHAIKRKSSGKRLVLAFFCAVACVGAIVYFVGSNLPDISVKVAAIQTGIEASYPSYIPRDYSLSDINSEDGKITMTFKGPEKASFTLIEEKSSWDSTALLRNYVEPTWQENYITTHEQGITIYISGSNAAWVNGGVLYKINTTGSALTKKQLRNIVTSM